MAGEVGGFAIAVIDEDADADHSSDGDNGAEEKLEHEAAGDAGFLRLSRLGGAGDTVEILKVVHETIITYGGRKW